MRRRWYVWLPSFGLVAGWTLGWAFLWQTYLLERFYPAADAGIHVFAGHGTDLRILWITTGVSLFLGSTGVALLVQARGFAADSPQWNRFWLASGIVLILVGLSLPILFPSAGSLVVDERGRTVALERRWVYAEAAEAMAFDEIERVSLRIERRLVRAGGACQIGGGLSIITYDRTVLAVPADFPYEEVAALVVRATGATLEDIGRREC